MTPRQAISRVLDLSFETWRALASYRRGPAILVVIVALLVAQWRFGADAMGVLVGAIMCTGFVVLAPLAWRLAFRRGKAQRWIFFRLVFYASTGVLVIYGLGWVLPSGMRLQWSFLTESTSLIVLLALYWVGGWGLGRDIDMEADLRHQREISQALAVQKEHAQLLALRTHLDPHFLFNTLNAIAEWTREDAEVAEAAILRLAGLLRTMLSGLQAERWALSRELSLCEDVIALFEVRDPGRFQYRREGDPPADLPVPPLLLLPLVENAMTHGPAAGHRGEVVLRFAQDEGDLVLELDNPGLFTGERDGGHGLHTVRRRLVLAWGGAASLEIFPLGDDGTRARVRLPLDGAHRAEETSP